MSSWRGHPIHKVPGRWVYVDTGQPVHHNPDRPCGACGLANTPMGHDGCLGSIPGVVNACCGHGDEAAAYVQLEGGERLGGREARIWIERIRALMGPSPGDTGEG